MPDDCLTNSEMFWSKVNKNGPTMPHMDTPCWVWTGTTNHGYGRFAYQKKRVSTHRAAVYHSTGVFPVLNVLHRCDNPPCCRPDHLYEGTAADNVRDMIERGRYRHRIHAIVTEHQVAAIKALLLTGQSHREIANQFCVKPHIVSDISAGGFAP